MANNIITIDLSDEARDLLTAILEQLVIYNGQTALCPEEAPDAVPEVEPAVKTDDIKKLVVELSAAGRKDEVRGSVRAHGANRVSYLPAEALSDVLDQLTALKA